MNSLSFTSNQLAELKRVVTAVLVADSASGKPNTGLPVPALISIIVEYAQVLYGMRDCVRDVIRKLSV